MVSSADALLCFYAQLSNAAKHTVVASRATVLGPIRRRYVWKGPRRPIADRHIVRLRVNESHEGWILRSIQGREVTLLKGRKSDVLALAPPGGSSEPASTPGFSEPAKKAA